MSGPIYLLRHGQTHWNVAGRMQGRLDSPLTALGRVQAARQGAVLRELGVVAPAVVSPLGRARATGALAGLNAEVDARLAEISMGDWEGRVIEDLPAAPGVSWKFNAPGGEAALALAARLTDLLAEVTGPTVLVTHGVVCIALQGLHAGTGPEGWDRFDDPQGVVLRLQDGRVTCFG